MSAIKELLEEKNWIISNIDGTTKWDNQTGARICDARAEYEAMRKVVEAAEKWLFEDEKDDLVAAINEYNLSQ